MTMAVFRVIIIFVVLGLGCAWNQPKSTCFKRTSFQKEQEHLQELKEKVSTLETRVSYLEELLEIYLHLATVSLNLISHSLSCTYSV